MPDTPILNMLKKCDILFDGEVVSNGLLVSTFFDYVVKLMDKQGKDSGLIYHTGSPIFDILLTVYVALSCIVYDEATPEELVYSLNSGDRIVFMDKTRAEFLGIDEKGFAKIRYGSTKGKHSLSTTETVAPVSFYKIKPYQGDATILDGRGIRTDAKAKMDFMHIIFGKSKSEISAINKKSAVVVCGRNFADSFVDKVQMRFDDHTIEITDLIPVSYFSENTEYHYRGNAGKNSPVLKFTCKVSKARDLVYEDTDKQVFAVVVLGGQAIRSGESELPDLVGRKSLKKTLLSMSIIEESADLCETYPDASVFASTKDMLLSYSMPMEPQGPLTTEQELHISNMLNREIVEHSIEDIISVEDYKVFRQSIASLRHQVQNDDIIERFIIESYSLINYLTNITFPLKKIECARENTGLECPSASEKIDYLESTVCNYSGALSDLLLNIFAVVEKAYRAVDAFNPKEQPLMNILAEASDHKEMLVLVPKAYHVDILKSLLPPAIIEREKLHIKTVGSFDYSSHYDVVLFTGCLGSKRFSIFSTFVAPMVQCLLYTHERALFNYQKGNSAKKENLLNSRTALKYKSLEEDIGAQTDNAEDAMDCQEIDNYIEEIAIKAALQAVSSISVGATTKADIVRIATTTEGESIFFTKYFTPYIFDRDEMTVTESTVPIIRAGDKLLFTKNSDQTKDIIEEIVIKIADSNEEIREAFRKSKHWKSKLLEYKESHTLSFQDLSDAMQEYGTPKHAVTLRTWLNPESRIIAPREEDSFYQIALICEDEEMLKSPESFHEACNTIRSLRVKILKLIGQSVIKSFQSKSTESTLFSDIIRKELDALSQVVQIDTIMDVPNVQVPITYTNRPYTL